MKNHLPLKQFRLALAILTLSLAFLPAQSAHARPAAATAYDLIAGVNAYRANTGLSQLAINDTIMASAQAHSDYQAFIGYGTHTGSGNSNETDRAIAAGYGGGKSVICDEAYAYATTATTIDTIIYTYWDDHDHRDLVLLNDRYNEVGAGATEKDGLIYYTLDVCVVTGSVVNTPKPTAAPGAAVTSIVAQPTAAAAATFEKKPLQTVAPNPDGSIVHVVQPNETMWDIAINYGMKVLDLCTMNGLSPSNPVVYIGQKITIRFAFTPTSSPTITETPKPPTRTPRPTRTLRPTSNVPTVLTTRTATAPPLLPEIPSLQTNSRQTIGIVIIVVCGLGLLLVFGLGRRKE